MVHLTINQMSKGKPKTNFLTNLLSELKMHQSKRMRRMRELLVLQIKALAKKMLNNNQIKTRT